LCEPDSLDQDGENLPSGFKLASSNSRRRGLEGVRITDDLWRLDAIGRRRKIEIAGLEFVSSALARAGGHQIRDRYPKASDISSPPCLLRLLPAGAVAGRGLHPLESAALSRRTWKADICSHDSKKGETRGDLLWPFVLIGQGLKASTPAPLWRIDNGQEFGRAELRRQMPYALHPDGTPLGKQPGSGLTVDRLDCG
jgi:hypothetical protein